MRLALNRPYTFVVMALMIIILGGVSIARMAVDIFPPINIPVVSVIWSFNGISPEEMEKRIVTVSERAFTTTVNDIEHIESQSYRGISVIKVFFHPGAPVEAAVAQLTAICQGLLRIMPPGITSPLILQYSASNVPILQSALSSETLSEQAINDYATNFIRTGLATVQGASIPLPYGGKNRQITVDLNMDALNSNNLSPNDITNAITSQNLILPAGTVKMGEKEYDVRLNNSFETVDLFNNIPVKQANNAIIYVRDVAHVHEGFSIQTNVVRLNGKRSSFLSILKAGSASTLDIVDRIKKVLPKVMATVPPELKMNLLFDQSLFVRASVNGVVREAIIAAALTGLMILMFLGSWRSTLVVVTSIPLSILTSIIVMNALGLTLNIMTLGGLALAVGILVDDATVEIENTTRNLMMEKPLLQAILDGASQIAMPALVSTFSICIVFLPIFFLAGVAHSLFSPLAAAVIFAMLASYLLSRTLVPVMMNYLIKRELYLYQPHSPSLRDKTDEPEKKPNLIWRIHEGFNKRFERLRERYKKILNWSLLNKTIVIIGFSIFCILSCCLLPFVGEDFFPKVDAGQFRLHLRVQPGTRIEQTEIVFGQIEDIIKKVIPPEELDVMLDNMGLPNSGINLAFGGYSSIGSFEGEILVSLKNPSVPTSEYEKKIRSEIKKKYSNVEVSFPPADIVGQILNFGISSPIDVQVVGRDQKTNYKIAREIATKISEIPGATDVYIPQVFNIPQIQIEVDRTKAEQIGLTQRDVANSLLTSLTSSGQTSPNFWLNPANGVSYFVAVQTPQYKITTMEDLGKTSIAAAGLNQPQLLTNISTVSRGNTMGLVSHYNVQATIDIFANVEDIDLGSVSKNIYKIVDDYKSKLPRGSSIDIRGQVESMNASFKGLAGGLIFAIMLVYLLMVINFQSWLDPLIIIMALPGAISGIAWMLFISQTTINVPSLMGAIMCIGVATSNSILLVTFANDEKEAGHNSYEAALSAGYTRLRPVVMTALAMIIGMFPMALGLGEGGEQNAPLGRAVIGGLIVATLSTLFFVPVMYSILRKKTDAPIKHE
ncbi:MAG TPA: efflux RND transporter permease subunit [Cytophagaceae bacterium]|nr:efflux RND transporter permease subunit [Cytophagaceae bacterium]